MLRNRYRQDEDPPILFGACIAVLRRFEEKTKMLSYREGAKNAKQIKGIDSEFLNRILRVLSVFAVKTYLHFSVGRAPDYGHGLIPPSSRQRLEPAERG
jgi:hypothetical protein